VPLTNGASPELVADAERIVAGLPDGTTTRSSTFQLMRPFMGTTMSPSSLRYGAGNFAFSSARSSSGVFGRWVSSTVSSPDGTGGTITNAVADRSSSVFVRRNATA
jgi:hypothetical protein